jgi:HSF-type DNA-binding
MVDHSLSTRRKNLLVSLCSWMYTEVAIPTCCVISSVLTHCIISRSNVAKVLPKFFKATKFTSFTRKLNRWGFTRVTRGPEVRFLIVTRAFTILFTFKLLLTIVRLASSLKMGSYFHKLFLRDEPTFCLRMSSHSSSKFQDAHHHLMPAPMAMPFGMPMPFMPGMMPPHGTDMAQQNQFINQQLQQLQWQQFQLQQFQQQQQQQQQQHQHHSVQQQGGPPPSQMQHSHMMHGPPPPHHHAVPNGNPHGAPIQPMPSHHHHPHGGMLAPQGMPSAPPPGGLPQQEEHHHASGVSAMGSNNKGPEV